MIRTLQKATFLGLYFYYTAFFGFAATAFGQIHADRDIKPVAKPAIHTEIITEEKWTGTLWKKSERTTQSYNAAGDLAEEFIDLWDDKTWVKKERTEYHHDGFFQQIAKNTFQWNALLAAWELKQSERDRIDTTDSKGNHIVLKDAVWNGAKKCFIADDSIVFDNAGRVKQSVNVHRDLTEAGDTNVTKETTINDNQNDGSWIETDIISLPGGKIISTDKSRYRKISETSALSSYQVDAWDGTMAEWITNAAQFYHRGSEGKSQLDSLNEIIDGRPQTVYLFEEQFDNRGNQVLERYLRKSYDEKTRKWSGNFTVEHRAFDAKASLFWSADSVLVWNQPSCKWKLLSYENILNKMPIDAGCQEAGSFNKKTHSWDQFRTTDSTISSGQVFTFERYWDTKEMKWMPDNRFTISKNADTVTIVEESNDDETDTWVNIARISTRIGKDGIMNQETYWNWVNGAPRGSWQKDVRDSYIRMYPAKK